MLDFGKKLNVKNTINDLIDMLNFSISTFNNARKRLEAIGLLDSFLRRDYLFLKIKPPLSGENFFKDDLLSSFLFSVIGRDKFKQFISKTFEEQDYRGFEGTKINANFIQAFGKLSLKKPDIEKKFLNNYEKKESPSSTSFNFPLIFHYLRDYGVSKEEIITERNFIISQHLIYGFNEQEMIKLLSNSILIDSKKISHHLFFSQVNNLKGLSFKPSFEGTQKKLKQESSKNKESPIIKKESHDDYKNMTAPDIQLIKASKGMYPFDFLRQIKNRKGGFVTQSEKKVIKWLFDIGLNQETINIVIHQVLIGADSTILSKPLAQAIADSFKQKRVTSSLEAIEFIKKRNQYKNKNSRKYTRRVLKKEKKIDYNKSKKINNDVAMKTLSEFEREKKNK